MRLIRKLSTISIICLLSVTIFAQNKKIQRAYETFNAGEYYQAIDFLKEAYEQTTNKEEKTKITFYIAECYRKTNQPRKAALWYSKVIKKDYNDPVVYLHYANMLKMNENYEEAKVQFKAYKELVPGDSRADDGILSCDLAREWKEFPNGYTVEELRFINSKLDDFSPAYAREDYRVLYFTSAREETTGKDEHGVTGQGFVDIFETTLDRKGKWSTPVPISSEVINTEYDDGTPILNRDYSRMYFARCVVREKQSTGCGIYVSQRKNDEWDKPKELELTSDTLVVAHPAISNDELTIYFVSDVDGSIAGPDGVPSKDIWMATRNSINDDFGEPVNMGEPINTSGNEAFPYVHPDGSFYFASTGHVGMGGYDIFKATKDESGEWKIENMRYPINSASDDFGICFESDREAGFLTSSRGRSDDIYTFFLPPLKFTISGIVKNEKTDEPIEGASVKSVGSDGITLETNTGKDGSFKFMLKPGTDYLFIAKVEGFLQGKERETTKSRETSMDFTTEIYLPPIDVPITVENIFFDFDSHVLRPESMVSLDKLVETLNDNPNVTIELSSHTDSRGNDEYNMNLSQARAQAVVDYLISKGIAEDRLVAKGYGESKPKIVDKKDHEDYPFLQEGQELNENHISSIEDDDLKEVAYYLNRRTEFFVLTTDYKPQE